METLLLLLMMILRFASSGQTGYTTDLLITKSAGSYVGGHIGMIDIITNTDLYLVSIT